MSTDVVVRYNHDGTIKSICGASHIFPVGFWHGATVDDTAHPGFDDEDYDLAVGPRGPLSESVPWEHGANNEDPLNVLLRLEEEGAADSDTASIGFQPLLVFFHERYTEDATDNGPASFHCSNQCLDADTRSFFSRQRVSPRCALCPNSSN